MSSRERDLSRLEESLAHLAGVRRARIEAESDEITSVKVLVIPEHNHAETIRRVQETVYKVTGQSLALDRIEVLSSGAAGSHGSAVRRKLLVLRTTREEDRFSAQVALELEGDVLVGEGEGPTGRNFELRCAARATLDALRIVLGFEVKLDSADILKVGDERVATVLVVNQRTGEKLVGSALVKVDANDAVVRATLRALDRLLSAPPDANQTRANANSG